MKIVSDCRAIRPVPRQYAHARSAYIACIGHPFGWRSGILAGLDAAAHRSNKRSEIKPGRDL